MTPTQRRSLEAIAALPPRLREVCRLLATAKSQREIASELGVTEHSARTYVKRIYEEIDVRSRPEFMALTHLQELERASIEAFERGRAAAAVQS
jgi:DNA-binding CsgD family transcriptional regulator